jgi:hypothetical protein
VPQCGLKKAPVASLVTLALTPALPRRGSAPEKYQKPPTMLARTAIAMLALGRAHAERTIVGINAGGPSCLHDGNVMEQDRYYLGGLPHSTGDEIAASEQQQQQSVISSSRIGPVVMYSLPVPGNAGDHGRGWKFVLELLFDTSVTFEAPFDGPVVVDILIQGVLVEHAVNISGPGG